MQSQGDLSEVRFQLRLQQFFGNKWDSLNDRQKTYAKKIWGILTYKWRWQIAMNVPYLAIFLLDRTVPAVHRFDMALLANVTSKFPMPAFISSLMRFG